MMQYSPIGRTLPSQLGAESVGSKSQLVDVNHVSWYAQRAAALIAKLPLTNHLTNTQLVRSAFRQKESRLVGG
jgi:hypothetical protein